MTVADVDWKVLEGMGCRWHLDGMGKYLMGRENFGLDGRRMRMQMRMEWGKFWIGREVDADADVDGKIFDGTEKFWIGREADADADADGMGKIFDGTGKFWIGREADADADGMGKILDWTGGGCGCG